jgi:MoaA/NifB/PqqE/SkfB family radical SAM enzyme
MKEFVKKVGMRLTAAALLVPGASLVALTFARLGMKLGRSWLRAHPDRYLTASKTLRFLHRRLGLVRDRDLTGATGRLWEKADRDLEAQVRAWMAAEPNPAELRRINHALVAYDADVRAETCKGFPFRGNIEITSHCNLRCPMCTQGVLSELTYLHLNVDRLKPIEPALRALEHLSLVGLGETFVHPDHREFIRRTKVHGVTLRVISNGILLDEDTARFLVETGLDELWISLDAVRPDTYRHIRGVDQFDRIVANIRRLNAIKAERGSAVPDLNMNFVARRSNIEQLPDFVRLAKDLGATAVHACYMMVYSQALRADSLFYDKPLANRYILEARQTAEELGLRFYGPDLFRLEDGAEAAVAAAPSEPVRQGYRGCREAWEFVFFNCEGRVVPCCVEQARLGDLAEADFAEIWNGRAYRDYRHSLKGDNASVFCQNCMMVGLRDTNREECHVRLLFEEEELRRKAEKDKKV